jgi:hypothetical protein
MNCNAARKRISLYREGEITPQEKQRLEQHLHNCESCKRFYQSYFPGNAIIEKLSEITPEPVNNQLLTARIMTTIGSLKEKAQQPDLSILLSRIVDLILLPYVRFTIFAGIITIILFFGYQQVFIFYSLSKLEKQLAAEGGKPALSINKEELNECVQKSSKWLSGFVTEKDKLKKSILKEIHENPEKLNTYLTFLCSYKHQFLVKRIKHKNMMVTASNSRN